MPGTNLILVGYRGSGKTTIGAILAKRLRRPFVDLDARIVEGTGCTIAEIFAAHGESGFRRREREACLALRKTENQVIALGGGAPTNPEIRAIMKRLGRIVWLRAPASVLWARISRNGTSPDSRPDLTSDGGLSEVETVLEQREPIYRRAADHVIDTFPGTPDEIADTIEIWYLANDSSRQDENSFER